MSLAWPVGARLAAVTLGQTVRQTRRDLRWVLRNRMTGAPASWAAGTVAKAGVAALPVAGFFYLFVLTFLDAHIPYWQLWAAATGALTALWVLGTVEPSTAPAPPPAGAPVEAPTRAFAQADRWALRLSATEEHPDRFATVVRDRMAELVATRLRQRHGVRLTAEPERARAILDPQLYRFLTEPVAHSPGPAAVERLITRIEEI